jgi:hypothetical protein
MSRPRDASPPAASTPPGAKVGCFGALALVAFGVLLGLVAVEIGLRLFVPVEAVFVKWDPVLGVRHRPGMKSWWYRETHGNRVWVEINSLGYRSPEIQREKPPGTLRVLMMGDSYLEGMQLPMEQVVSERLRALLEDSLPGRRIEVVNAGNMGYGQAEQSLFLNREGWALAPDLVISMLYLGNDLTDNWSGTGSRIRPSYDLAGDSLVLRPPHLPGWKIFLRDHVLAHLALPKAIRMYMIHSVPWAKRWAAEQGLILRDLGRAESHDDLDRMMAVTQRLLDRMRQDCDAHGVPLVVFEFPHGFDVVRAYPDSTYMPIKMWRDARGAAWEWDYVHQGMRRYWDRSAQRRVDGTSGFNAGAARGDTLYIDFGGHWNARGHDLAAWLLADYVMKNRLLGEPAPGS